VSAEVSPEETAATHQALQQFGGKYKTTTHLLNGYFLAWINVQYEREVFAKLQPVPGSSVDDYVVTLRRHAECYDFGDRKN
jgi:hypothetical protein